MLLTAQQDVVSDQSEEARHETQDYKRWARGEEMLSAGGLQVA